MQIPGQKAITSGQNANTFANPANCENAEGEREMTGCSAISARMDISSATERTTPSPAGGFLQPGFVPALAGIQNTSPQQNSVHVTDAESNSARIKKADDSGVLRRV